MNHKSFAKKMSFSININKEAKKVETGEIAERIEIKSKEKVILFLFFLYSSSFSLKFLDLIFLNSSMAFRS
ncbi:MAG: Unknown protein [uncultured Sulfurovum sp.]|uniref:Uncharacterized protein n=1 Tax=uncultured Sulfurovum sp. TaxID=269237 RepID=A0A6S6SBN7_9BACT|nr:MAG: Unknown protein [uncultured Sulfurovum sp.]